MSAERTKNKIKELAAAAVAQKLEEMTLLDCTDLVVQNGIDGKRLLNMTELELRGIFHNIPRRDKVKLWKYIKAIQRNPEFFFGGSTPRCQVNRSSSFASALEKFRNLERKNLLNGEKENKCAKNNTRRTTKGLHQGNNKQSSSQVEIPDEETIASSSETTKVQGTIKNQTWWNKGSTEKSCSQVEISDDDDEVFLARLSQLAKEEGPNTNQTWQNKQQSYSQVEISDDEDYDILSSSSKPAYVEGPNNSSLKSTKNSQIEISDDEEYDILSTKTGPNNSSTKNSQIEVSDDGEYDILSTKTESTSSQVEIQDDEVASPPTIEEADQKRYLPSPKLSGKLAPPRPSCPKPLLRSKSSSSQREIAVENYEELLQDYEIVQSSQESTNETSVVMEYDLLVSKKESSSNDPRPISGKYQPPPKISTAPKPEDFRANVNFKSQKKQSSKFYINDEKGNVAKISNPYENVSKDVSQESSYGYEAEPQVNRTLMDAISDGRYKPQPNISESVRHLGPHISEKPRRGKK